MRLGFRVMVMVRVGVRVRVMVRVSSSVLLQAKQLPDLRVISLPGVVRSLP